MEKPNLNKSTDLSIETFSQSDDQVCSTYYSHYYMIWLGKKKKESNFSFFSYYQREKFLNALADLVDFSELLFKTNYNLLSFTLLSSVPLFLLSRQTFGYQLKLSELNSQPKEAMVATQMGSETECSTKETIGAIQINPIFETSVIPKPPMISLSMTHHAPSSVPSKKVVVGCFQPNLVRRNFYKRAYMPVAQTKFVEYRERQALTVLEMSAIQVAHNGNVIAMGGVQRFRNIEVINTYMQSVQEVKMLPVEKKVSEVLGYLDKQSKMAQLTNVISFEGWTNLDSELPTLTLGVNASYGRYKHGTGLSKFVDDVLVSYCEDNPEMKFLLRCSPSEAEHPNQKNQLESVLLKHKDGHAYQLPPDVHKLKTSQIDLRRPDEVGSIQSWFIYNGDQTFALIKEIFENGFGNCSPELLKKYEIAIGECVQADIADFNQTGLSSTSLDFPGQIRALKIGKKDLANFYETLMVNIPQNLDLDSVKTTLKGVVKKAKLRAAYINAGTEIFPLDSAADQAQKGQSKLFLDTLDALMIRAKEVVPSVFEEKAFQKELCDFQDILNGVGNYHKIVKGKAYQKFLQQLKNPKSHLNMVSRKAVHEKGR